MNNDEMTMDELAIEQKAILEAQQHRAMIAKKVAEQAANRNPEEHERKLAKLRIIKTDELDAMDKDSLYEQLLSRTDIKNFYDDTKATEFIIPNFQRASFEPGTATQYRDYLLKKWGKDSIEEVKVDAHIRKLVDVADRCKWEMDDKHKGQVALDIAELRNTDPVQSHYLKSKVNLEKALFQFKDGPFDQEMYENLLTDYKTLRKYELTHALTNDVDTPQSFLYTAELVSEAYQLTEQQRKAEEKALAKEGFNQDYALVYHHEMLPNGKKITVDLIDKSNDVVIGKYSQAGNIPNEHCRNWIQSRIAEHRDIELDQVELKPVNGMLAIRLLTAEQLEEKTQQTQNVAKTVDPLKAAIDNHLFQEFKEHTNNLSYKESDRNVIAFENSKLLYEVHQNEDADFFKKLQKKGIPILPKSIYDTAIEAQKNKMALEAKISPEQIQQKVAEQVQETTQPKSLSSKIHSLRQK